jgi:predicted RNA polymerase sigma factor
MGRASDAADAYARAIELVKQDPERRYLERRLAEVMRSA